MVRKVQIITIYKILAFIFFIFITNIFIDKVFGDGDGEIHTFNIHVIVSVIIFGGLFISFTILTLKHPSYIFYLCVLFLLIDLLIVETFYSQLSKNTYQNHLYKKPMPYIGFSGYPDTVGHNKYGYIGPDLSKSTNKDFIIAFFGGSIGYNGDPAIPKLIELELKKNNFNSGNVFISNFSVVASNHNQHLHMIIESLMLKNVDLVIFYGGYNETIQTSIL